MGKITREAHYQKGTLKKEKVFFWEVSRCLPNYDLRWTATLSKEHPYLYTRKTPLITHDFYTRRNFQSQCGNQLKYCALTFICNLNLFFFFFWLIGQIFSRIIKHWKMIMNFFFFLKYLTITGSSLIRSQDMINLLFLNHKEARRIFWKWLLSFKVE